MSESRSLQGRCTVCYAEQPKYRCPRCKTQTCSLPCYKRHQQRAACDGQRNPAEFVKKSQWATPHGIDRDYNYLKSIERNIERAGEDIKPVVEEPKQKNHRQPHSESNLQRYMQQNHITVNRAPAGMSKARANKTRVTQSGKVYWTIAWVDEEGSEFVDQDCPESSKLVDLYISATIKRARNFRQDVGDNTLGPMNKRRRIEEVSASEAGPATSKEHDETDAASEARSMHFYLLRPGSLDTKILAPLPAQHTLTMALRDRIIQEFPTIYALPYEADDLPTTYLLEATFLARQKPVATIPDVTNNTSEPQVPLSKQQPDAAKILQMLRRDVHST